MPFCRVSTRVSGPISGRALATVRTAVSYTHLDVYKRQSVGRVALAKLNIVCGIASIEDAFGHLAEIFVLKQDEILTEEPRILKRANAMMPRFAVDRADVLIMMEMGKDVSGSGLDSNLIGRYNVPFVKGGPDFRCVCVLDPVSYTHLDVYKRQI